MSEGANNEMNVGTLLDHYQGEWAGRDMDQTTLFRAIVPTEEGDYTEVFNREQLDKIFTGDRLSTKMLGSWNCNHLFRDSQKMCDIVIYSTDNYTVLHPMGEPGRDLGDLHGSKASHLMIVTHGPGPITFNELLPSTQEEVSDLDTRLKVMQRAVLNLQGNVPVSQCGTKVAEKAAAMGYDTKVGIRQFMAAQITGMPEDKRAGRPGYMLQNESGEPAVGPGSDPAEVERLIDTVFSNTDLEPFMCIQPPDKNSQLLSHIHCFLLGPELPSLIHENYINAELICLLKQDKLTSAEMGGGLCRQMTVSR
jgi:hypothetical protein